MIKRLILSIWVIALFSFLPILSAKEFPVFIIGTWKFESFQFPNYIPANGLVANRWKRTFTGVTYTFTKTKLISSKTGGEKLFNFSMPYGFSRDNRFLTINGKEVYEIDYLDKERLNIYANGGPVAYFVRVKQGPK